MEKKKYVQVVDTRKGYVTHLTKLGISKQQSTSPKILLRNEAQALNTISEQVENILKSGFKASISLMSTVTHK